MRLRPPTGRIKMGDELIDRDDAIVIQIGFGGPAVQRLELVAFQHHVAVLVVLLDDADGVVSYFRRSAIRRRLGRCHTRRCTGSCRRTRGMLLELLGLDELLLGLLDESSLRRSSSPARSAAPVAETPAARTIAAVIGPRASARVLGEGSSAAVQRAADSKPMESNQHHCDQKVGRCFMVV